MVFARQQRYDVGLPRGHISVAVQFVISPLIRRGEIVSQRQTELRHIVAGRQTGKFVETGIICDNGSDYFVSTQVTQAYHHSGNAWFVSILNTILI